MIASEEVSGTDSAGNNGLCSYIIYSLFVTLVWGNKLDVNFKLPSVPS